MSRHLTHEKQGREEKTSGGVDSLSVIGKLDFSTISQTFRHKAFDEINETAVRFFGPTFECTIISACFIVCG
jgi:hypothetical protein